MSTSQHSSLPPKKKTRPRASAPEASLVAPAGWGASPRQVRNIIRKLEEPNVADRINRSAIGIRISGRSW